MARQKVTLYLDPDLLRAMRVAAARRGIKDSDLVEEAVREHVGIGAWERVQAAAAPLVQGMSEEQVTRWAVELQHDARGTSP